MGGEETRLPEFGRAASLHKVVIMVSVSGMAGWDAVKRRSARPEGFGRW